jgi:hypothetical protein
MESIKNVQPLSPESVFDLLKKEFADFANTALSSNLSVEYAHVADVINIMFPEITEGIVFSLTVSEDVIDVDNYVIEGDYNTDLLGEQLVEFLTQKAS